MRKNKCIDMAHRVYTETATRHCEQSEANSLSLLRTTALAMTEQKVFVKVYYSIDSHETV